MSSHRASCTHSFSVESVRLYNDGSFSVLHAREEELDSEDSGWPNYEVMEGDTVALVDPVVTKSRLVAFSKIAWGTIVENCLGEEI